MALKVVELSDQDDNSQGAVSSRILKPEVLVQSHQNIEVSRRCCHQRAISKPSPAHLRDAPYFVAGKGQSKARVHALVKEDAHSFICSPASSRKL
jgi:hypothetical protein